MSPTSSGMNYARRNIMCSLVRIKFFQQLHSLIFKRYIFFNLLTLNRLFNRQYFFIIFGIVAFRILGECFINKGWNFCLNRIKGITSFLHYHESVLSMMIVVIVPISIKSSLFLSLFSFIQFPIAILSEKVLCKNSYLKWNTLQVFSCKREVKVQLWKKLIGLCFW